MLTWQSFLWNRARNAREFSCAQAIDGRLALWLNSVAHLVSFCIADAVCASPPTSGDQRRIALGTRQAGADRGGMRVRRAADAGLVFPPRLDIIYDWSYITSMKKVAAAKFKEQCLSILDHLQPEGIVITKHGKPVARLLPIERVSAELIGSLRDRIHVKDNILTTGLDWDASG